MDLGSRLLRWVRRVAPRAVVPVALLATLGLVGFGVLFLARPADPGPGPAPSASPAVNPPDESPLIASTGDAPHGELSVVLAPRGSGGTEPGEELIVDVVIVNRTDEAVPPGELTFRLLGDTIDTRFALSAWMGDVENDVFEVTSELTRLASPRVAAGESAPLSMTLPPGALFGEGGQIGPRGLEAELRTGSSGDEPIARGRSVAVASDGTIPVTPLTIVVPVVAPLETEPVLNAATLSSLTAPSGQLTRLLDAVHGTGAVLAIDPRILLSIRALGDGAPASAVNWLSRLEAMPNESFALPYGDADLALEAQAGLGAPLELDSLGFALGDASVPGPSEPAGTASGTTPAPEPSGAGDEGDAEEGTPSPSHSAGSETDAAQEDPAATSPAQTTPGTQPGESAEPGAEQPGYAELTAFPHEFDEVLLPSPGTLPEDHLSQLSSWGYGNLLLDGGDIAWDGDPGFTPDAHALVSGQPAMVADHELSRALSQAAGNTGVDHEAAMAAAEAILATVSRELPSEQRTQLAVIDREIVQGDLAGLSATLRGIRTLGWTQPASLSFDADPSELPEATLISSAHDDAAITGVRELVAAEQRANLYASIFDDPEAHRSGNRAALIQAISAGWNARPQEWVGARQQLTGDLLRVQGDVAIVPTSEIHVVGQETQLPVFVSNGTDERVTIRVDLRPTTGHIEAAGPMTLTVEAGSMARAIVPIQVVTNGRASAQVTITTPDGQPFTSQQTVTMNVSAQLETIIAASGASVLGVAVVWGVARTIRKRRESRAPGAGIAATGPHS